MKRRAFIAGLGSAAAWPVVARAQQAGKVYRIGFLGNDPTIPTQVAGKAFVEGLRDNGFVEGKNIVIERRFAEGRRDRALELAAELVGLDVDLIATSSVVAVAAAKEGTIKIPIVMLNIFDPVGMGLVANLAHPGGSITGMSGQVSPEMAGKRLTLLKEAVPGISRVAVLVAGPMDPDIAQGQAEWDALRRAAPTLNVTLQFLQVRQAVEFNDAFATMSHDRPDAFITTYSGLNLIYRNLIAEFATNNRLPSMHTVVELAEAGGLMSYGADRADLFRRAATYVAKILKGAKPADLPIEQPTKFEFVINLKTAKALGLEIPPQLLGRADLVIE
jgi:putative ABC transport system substrate-binding protein